MTFITIISLVALALVFAVVFFRMRSLRAGRVVAPDIASGGLTRAYLEMHAMYRTLYRRVAAYSKLAFQYIFHILVRVLFYVQKGFDALYVWARNRFMRNAVKSKASVSFFWSHLKEYKNQIESEREDSK